MTKSEPKGIPWDAVIRQEIMKLIDQATEMWSKLNAKFKKLELKVKALEEKLK